MSYKIEKKIIPGLSQGKLAAPNLIIAHESGNPNNTGPNSLNSEVNYMTNNWRTAFTSHWVGSGGRIVQLAHPGKLQYGAGPVANPYSYAHVELARTNNTETFKKDYAAYVWLLRKLADDAGIPKTLDAGTTKFHKGIKSHNWVTKNLGGTTHTDPYAYLASFGVTKAQFKKDVEAGGSITVKPSKPSTSKPTTSKPKTSGSVVDYMKSKNIDASFGNRKKLATQYGIKNYTGTASQNSQLLSKLKAGKPSKQSRPSKPTSSGYKGSSLVDYLKSVGQPTTFNYREKLAKQNGIGNYKGTASQNTELLNKLRGGSVSKPSKTVKQMADMIIKGKNVPIGHTARQKWLGVDKATYEKVRAEVNKRM